VALSSGRAGFEELPEDDPHHLLSLAEQKENRKQMRQEERRTRLYIARNEFLTRVRRRNPALATEMENRWREITN
jgi:hypothetical protein